MNADRAQILLVDDDADLLRLLAIRLEAAGHVVATAPNAERALAMVSAQRPRLVITDMRMPGMDGGALFEAIRNLYPTLPVIILTAHGTIPDAVAATNRGVFGYLTKPYDARQLLEKIDNALSLSSSNTEGGVTDPDWRAEILTRNAAMESLLEQARMVAASDASVMIQGNRAPARKCLRRRSIVPARVRREHLSR
jgi:two-component system response regulator GlrR